MKLRDGYVFSRVYLSVILSVYKGGVRMLPLPMSLVSELVVVFTWDLTIQEHPRYIHICSLCSPYFRQAVVGIRLKYLVVLIIFHPSNIFSPFRHFQICYLPQGL